MPHLSGILKEKDNIFFLFYSPFFKKNHKSLKAGDIFMYFLNKYLLSIWLGAFRIWEYSVSGTDVVPALRG